MPIRPKTPVVGTIRLRRASRTDLGASVSSGTAAARPMSTLSDGGLSPPYDDDERVSVSHGQTLSDALPLLVASAAASLDTLDPATNRAFQTMLRAAHEAHENGTYRDVYKQIVDAFDSDTPFKLGTVAAFVKGCTLKTNMTQRGCSILAASALPHPDDPPCPSRVILGTIRDGRYTFITLDDTFSLSSSSGVNQAPRTASFTHAYVFVPQGFVGFSKTERGALSDLCEKYTVYEMNTDGTEYKLVPTYDVQRVRTLPAVVRPETALSVSQQRLFAGGSAEPTLRERLPASWTYSLVLFTAVLFLMFVIFAAQAYGIRFMPLG